MKTILTEGIVEIAVVCAILWIIQFAWIGLEILFDGGVQPSTSDTIVGIVMAISIYGNLRIKATRKN